MNKKWLGWLLLAGLVGVTAVFFLTKEAPRTPIPEPVEAVYELTPTLADQGGMDVATAFSLKHPETVAEAYLQEALSFSPEIDFEIERVSPAEVVIKPLALLKEDQVYQVALRDQPLNSWAFQTKKQLKEIATLPGDRAQYVATDSGVEIQFNFKDLENFEEAFEITPAVSGTFSRNGYSQIFIPDALEARTTYRVTLDSDLRVAGSDITLGEDLSFSFTTAAGEGGFGLTLKDEFFNYTTAQNHFVPAYMTEGARAETYALAVYAYPDPQMFLDHLMALEEGTAMETLYGDLSRGRQALAAFDTRPEAINLNYDSFSVFEMPRPLEEGHYLVRISLGDRHWYGFIQVNDLLVYSARFEESQLFWVSDAGTHEGVPGAEVTLSEGPKGLTDQEGIALVADKTPRDPEKPLYATVHKEGRTPFVMRSVMGPRDWYESSHGWGIQETSNDYFKYLYTDRSTYLPTDQVAVFGYLKPRTDAAGDYTLQFISRDYGEKVLQEADLPLTLHGTFTQTFNFKDLAPGAYTLLVKAGEETLLSREISVTPYIKPLYRLSGDFTRDYFTRGQEVVFEVEAAFFDGTPAVDMPLDYSAHAGENHQGRVETDLNGRGTVRFTPDYETDYWRPQAIHLDLYNAGAEDMRISLHDSYTYFPKDTMIRIFSEDSTGVRIEVNELVAGNYDEGPDFTLFDLKGAPLDRKLKIEVVEHYFEKVEKGTRYDYINKVNRPLVEYQKRERVVESLWAATVEGVCFHETPYLEGSDSSFEMTVTLEEEGGRILETAYLHDGGGDNWINPDFNFYTLEAAGANEGFKLGETVDYRFTDQGEPVVFTDDRFLVMTLKEGLVDYRILQTPEGNMTFKEAFLPNVHLKGVLLREGMLTRTFDATLIKFDPSEREADITVTADAPTYPPGGMVELRILTRDGAGEPVSADVNVSVVDEAYFALYQQGVDFLKDLYAPMDGTGIQREFVSTDLSGANFDFYGMAEGGGPEGDYAIRRDFKDTALFMTLSTDDKGEGLLRFALPDNLTSWRVTYQGINDKMEAASGKLNLTTALPFYMVPLVSQVYLTGDEPAISLRVFGEAVDQGAPVAYRVALDGETRQAFGPGGDYTRIPLGRLAGGTHTLLMTADQEGYGDGMEKTLEVKDSTVTFNYTKAYSLGAETVLTPVESVAGITFRNQSESPFIATLFDLVYGGGQRVDQKLGALEAGGLIRRHLDGTLKMAVPGFGAYQETGGGIRLLPYAEADPVLSARIALMGSEAFDEDLLKAYFHRILYQREAARLEVVAALTGLAALKEPVLLDIQALLEEDLTPREDLLLALALGSLGDLNRVGRIYEAFDPGVLDQEDPGEAFLLKGLLMNLALQAGDLAFGDEIFQEIYEEPSEYELVHLERIHYLKQRDFMDSEEVAALEGSVTYTIGEKTGTLDFFGYESESLSLTPEEVGILRFTRVEGDILAQVHALVGAEYLDEAPAADFALSRTYEVDGAPATTFEVGDLVKVTLMPEIPGDKKDFYEITDFIPAGFRLQRLGSNAGWYKEEGQKMIFYYWPQEKVAPVIYYLQAVLPGSYRADHAVMVKSGEPGVHATPQENLVIE